MNFIKKLKHAFNKNATTTDKDLTLQGLIDFLNLNGCDKGALSEATYFACMKVLTEAIAKLPIKLYKYSETQGITEVRNHPLYNVLHDRPNRYMTASTFWGTIEFNRNHYGNAYALIDTSGKNTNLWILPSQSVEIWYDNAKLLKDVPDIYYIYSCSAGRFAFSSEEILHFKTSNTLDGITGISVKDQLKMTIDGNIKAQDLVNKMYDNGFTAKAVLQYTESLSDENAMKFVKGIEAYSNGKMKDKGIENIIPIPLGAQLTPLNVKLADNQFIEVKQYSALQIASAFGIKPYQIGDYTKSSYSSAEAQQLSFYIDTLLYIIKQYEEELTYKLLSDEDIKNGLHFKFNVNVILRADFETQINSLSTAVNSFLMTPNEARAKLDLEAKPGGDRLLGNGASIPVELTGSQYTNKNTEEGDK